MNKEHGATWNPEAYQRFKDHRLRPAVDLIHALPSLPDGPIVDLGCGNGSVGEALNALDRPLIGVDSSPDMLKVAQTTGMYADLIEAKIETWHPETAPALIFSNAALHWVSDHETLFPALFERLAPGGTLAIQMPHQNNAPSHHIWRSLAEEFWPNRIGKDFDGPGVLLPAQYHRMLSALGHLSLWETEYYQTLPADPDGHPVRRFTEATFALPIFDKLNEAEIARIIRAYEDVIGSAYPSSDDGSVLFPFKRLFMVLTHDPA